MRRILIPFVVLIAIACKGQPSVPPPDRIPVETPLAAIAEGELPPHEAMDVQATAVTEVTPEVVTPTVIEPRIELLSPANEEVVDNPVHFRYRTFGAVASVTLLVDEIPLNEKPLPPVGELVYELRGVNVIRVVKAEAYNEHGELLAWEARSFVPSEGFVPIPPGFNRFVVQAINDISRYPRDGSTPYCWRKCPGSMGLIRDVYYMEEVLWPGEGSCFCTGHTLEIFLDAVHRWYAFHGLDPETPFGELLPDDVQGGDFYQQWQGYGISPEASAAAAFERAGIGYAIWSDSWDDARTGDFVNLSRDDATGHAVIFHSWVWEDGRRVGLRYYGCNGKGDSHPTDSDPGNKRVSGPSFVSAKFHEFGGKVLPEYLFIGHVVDPMLGF
jgi:hypothetical protein